MRLSAIGAFFAIAFHMVSPAAYSSQTGEKPRFNTETFCEFEKSLQAFARFHTADDIIALDKDLRFIQAVYDDRFNRRHALRLLNNKEKSGNYPNFFKADDTICNASNIPPILPALFTSIGTDLHGLSIDDLGPLRQQAWDHALSTARLKPDSNFLKEDGTTCPFAKITEYGKIVTIQGGNAGTNSKKLIALDPIFDNRSSEYHIKIPKQPEPIDLILETRNIDLWNLDITDPADITSVTTIGDVPGIVANLDPDIPLLSVQRSNLRSKACLGNQGIRTIAQKMRGKLHIRLSVSKDGKLLIDPKTLENGKNKNTVEMRSFTPQPYDIKSLQSDFILSGKTGDKKLQNQSSPLNLKDYLLEEGLVRPATEDDIAAFNAKQATASKPRLTVNPQQLKNTFIVTRYFETVAPNVSRAYISLLIPAGIKAPNIRAGSNTRISYFFLKDGSCTVGCQVMTPPELPDIGGESIIDMRDFGRFLRSVENLYRTESFAYADQTLSALIDLWQLEEKSREIQYFTALGELSQKLKRWPRGSARNIFYLFADGRKLTRSDLSRLSPVYDRLDRLGPELSLKKLKELVDQKNAAIWETAKERIDVEGVCPLKPKVAGADIYIVRRNNHAGTSPIQFKGSGKQARYTNIIVPETERPIHLILPQTSNQIWNIIPMGPRVNLQGVSMEANKADKPRNTAISHHLPRDPDVDFFDFSGKDAACGELGSIHEIGGTSRVGYDTIRELDFTNLRKVAELFIGEKIAGVINSSHRGSIIIPTKPGPGAPPGFPDNINLTDYPVKAEGLITEYEYEVVDYGEYLEKFKQDNATVQSLIKDGVLRPASREEIKTYLGDAIRQFLTSHKGFYVPHDGRISILSKHGAEKYRWANFKIPTQISAEIDFEKKTITSAKGENIYIFEKSIELSQNFIRRVKDSVFLIPSDINIGPRYYSRGDTGVTWLGERKPPPQSLQKSTKADPAEARAIITNLQTMAIKRFLDEGVVVSASDADLRSHSEKHIAGFFKQYERFGKRVAGQNALVGPVNSLGQAPKIELVPFGVRDKVYRVQKDIELSYDLYLAFYDSTLLVPANVTVSGGSPRFPLRQQPALFHEDKWSIARYTTGVEGKNAITLLDKASTGKKVSNQPVSFAEALGVFNQLVVQQVLRPLKAHEREEFVARYKKGFLEAYANKGTRVGKGYSFAEQPKTDGNAKLYRLAIDNLPEKAVRIERPFILDERLSIILKDKFLIVADGVDFPASQYPIIGQEPLVLKMGDYYVRGSAISEDE